MFIKSSSGRQKSDDAKNKRVHEKTPSLNSELCELLKENNQLKHFLREVNRIMHTNILSYIL